MSHMWNKKKGEHTLKINMTFINKEADERSMFNQ